MQQCRCDLCIVSGILIWILKKLILSIYLANFAAIKYTSLRLAVELFCWGCYKHGYYYFVDEWTSAVDTTNTCAEGYALWGSLRWTVGSQSEPWTVTGCSIITDSSGIGVNLHQIDILMKELISIQHRILLRCGPFICCTLPYMGHSETYVDHSN